MAQKPIKEYHSDAKKKDEVIYNVVIMSPLPGKMNEVRSFPLFIPPHTTWGEIGGS